MSLVTSDTSVEKAGLLQLCEFNLFGDAGYTQITGNASRLAGIVNFLNEAYSRYFDLAMRADGRWQIDDTNYTTVPIATANLVSGQQDYGLNTTHIKLLQVEIKDSAGTWRPLGKIDESDFARNDQSLSQYYDNSGTAVTGIPLEYNLIGVSVFLYPTPNYNSTNGLRVRFQRPPSYFLTTDTTKVPGFPEIHHTYLTDYASYKYAISRGLAVADRFALEVAKWEQKTIPEFYNRRNAAEAPIMTGKKTPHI